MIARIVVPVDDSTTSARALPVAAALAHLAHASLLLVEVVPMGGDVARCEGRLAEMVASVGADLEVATKVHTTSASVGRALGHLELAEGDVVCMSTRGRGVVRQLVLGSVAGAVVRRAATPVLVIGPRCATAGPTDLHEPAVAALSGHRADHDVVVTAVGWAKATGASIRAIHVVTAPSEASSWAHADEVVGWARAQAGRYGVEITPETVAATDVDRGLAEAAGDAGCIVTASHRRGAIGRFVLGSTVAAVAQTAACPVLVAAPRTADTPADEEDRHAQR